MVHNVWVDVHPWGGRCTRDSFNCRWLDDQRRHYRLLERNCRAWAGFWAIWSTIAAQFHRVNTGNQVVLGTFIATFMYCLLVLRTINAGEDSEFVPHISVTFGVVLAIASIAVLIYFIHHAATSIQAQHVIAAVGQDLDETIDRLFPKKIGRGAPEHRRRIEEDIPADFERDACPIRAVGSGYIQAVDDEELMKIATENNLLVRLNHRPGNFVVRLSDLVIATWLKKISHPPIALVDDNKLRVIADPVTFAGMTDAAFNQIRQYGQSSVAVTIRLLEAIAVIAAHTHLNRGRVLRPCR